MDAQSDPSGRLPDSGQRSHSYVNEVGDPVHDPSVVVIVWPTTAAPVSVGRAVLLGAAFVLAEPAGESSAATVTVASSNAKPT